MTMVIDGCALQEGDELIRCNGIDGVTGRYALDAVPVRALADVARRELRIDGVPEANSSRSSFELHRLALLLDLSEVGWGIVFAKGVAPEVRAALAPLIEHRRAQAGALLKELEFDPDADTFSRWLRRHGVHAMSPDRSAVPFYLLLVGPPSAVPFEFQYLLDIEYAVGRIAFDTPAEYARYAASVVAYERESAKAAARDIVYWGTRHEGDPATQLSADCLLEPLMSGHGGAPPVAAKRGFRQVRRAADEATKASLLEALHRPAGMLPPAMLFTASHGLSWPKDHERQAAAQGALLSQEWELFDAVEPRHYVAAEDVRDDARVHGLVAFFFACFGAGTPALDNFRTDRGRPPAMLAEQPFVSALSRRLLAHPGGGALAVIGHVDRAWGYSIRPPSTRPQIAPFRVSIDCILRGLPIGLATTDFSLRYATLSAGLLSWIDQISMASANAPSDRELAWAWIERNDAQSYVLLGDPAAALRTELLA
ncbi:hypothetical protein [Sorangium sp. So ce1389]|uniref:hypothetical protein n=1 Tax=Sorangium sp. So ce1389 TaxID=3133336 RepID=UPI003F634AC6